MVGSVCTSSRCGVWPAVTDTVGYLISRVPYITLHS
jgi:hypothetical protein